MVRLPSSLLLPLLLACIDRSGATPEQAINWTNQHQAPEPTPDRPTPADRPACSVDVADMIFHLTGGATIIARLTTDCTKDVGWDQEDASDRAGFPDGYNPPIFDQGLCADRVLWMLSRFTWAVEDSFAASFDCASTNVACGQAISDAMRSMWQAFRALARGSRFCEDSAEVGGDPVAGFLCWRWLWRAIERALRMAKFIDIAFSTCSYLMLPEADGLDDDYDNETTDGDEPAPVPVPVISTASVVAMAQNLNAQASPSTQSSSDWADLQQPVAFSTVGVDRHPQAQLPTSSTNFGDSGTSLAPLPPPSVERRLFTLGQIPSWPPWPVLVGRWWHSRWIGSAGPRPPDADAGGGREDDDEFRNDLEGSTEPS